MFKKITSLSSLVAILTVLFLFVTSTMVFAESRGSDLRQATDYSHLCEVPYNIEIPGSYTTGLHIVADWIGSLDFTFRFFRGGEAYAENTKTIGPEGWTGLASALLPAGKSLLLPTLIYVYSHVDSEYVGTDEEEFWVTQFLITDFGFSHQTLASHKEGVVLY